MRQALKKNFKHLFLHLCRKKVMIFVSAIFINSREKHFKNCKTKMEFKNKNFFSFFDFYFVVEFVPVFNVFNFFNLFEPQRKWRHLSFVLIHEKLHNRPTLLSMYTVRYGHTKQLLIFAVQYLNRNLKLKESVPWNFVRLL